MNSFRTASLIGSELSRETLDRMRHLLYNCSENMMQRILKPWLRNDCINRWFGFDENAAVEARAIIKQSIAQRRQERASRQLTGRKMNNANTCYLDELLDLEDSDDELNEDDICDEIATFMIASYDTTRVATGFLLFYLALHADYQQIVYDEVVSVCGNDDETIMIDNSIES